MKIIYTTLLAFMLVVLSSCGTKDEGPIIIPLEDSVRDQYLIAERQVQKARGIFDKEVEAEEINKAIAAFRVVEERFPNDPTFPPAAALRIAELYSDQDEQILAAQEYRRALETYPEDSDVRVVGLLGLGTALDQMGQYEEAKVFFKLLIDEYRTTTNPEYKQAVEQARNLYRQIR